MNLNENSRCEANVDRQAAQSRTPMALSVPIVRVLIASATGMRAYAVLDLADEHDIAQLLDCRRDQESDASTFARLLGPCYARLPSDPRAAGLCIGEIATVSSPWLRQSPVLVLADDDQAEPLVTLARTACEVHVAVEFVPIPALPKEAGYT